MWWKETENGYLFLDGDDDPISHPEGPRLRHHRSTSMVDVSKSSKPIWNEILAKKINLPTPILQLYNDSGMSISKRVLNHGSLTEEYEKSDETIRLNLNDQHNDHRKEYNEY